jgi:hypothetical protein
MEFIEFKIKSIEQSSFEQTFEQIIKEGKIDCNQWEFHYEKSYTIAKIPKYAVDKMTSVQIELLREYVI